MATFDTVRKLGLALDGVEEGTMYGSPALKLHGRLVACLAVHRSAEPGSLVVRTDFDERANLLAEEPETYYLTDHYVNHPVAGSPRFGVAFRDSAQPAKDIATLCQRGAAASFAG